ncbi:MAG: acyloxyacyl hydrolase [Bacteroidales bacterium]|nr:acyloxyacyl hydrolase [Bacteroidales bacterium]
MKKVFLICLLTVQCHATQAQQAIQWKFDWLYGNILKHTKHLEQTVKGPTQGAELSMEWATVPDLSLPARSGKRAWPAYYLYPDVGLSATALNLGNDTIFGNLLALYPYFRFHLINLKWIQLNLKTGAGVSYLTKTFQDARYFDPNGTLVLGRSNAAIGSHLNVYFAMGGELTLPLGKSLELAGTFSWNHASNGSFYQPNSGINMLNGGLGFRYYPSANRKTVANTAWLTLKRTPVDLPVEDADDKRFKTGLELIISGGARQLYYRDNKMFPTGALTLVVYRPVSRQLRLGIGADGFYDGVFAGVNSAADATQNTSRFKRTYLTDDLLVNRFRGGMSLQPELMFGKLTAGVHFGVYLYNPIRNLEPYTDAMNGAPDKGIFYPYDIEKEDGWFYTRASLKYSLTPHLLLHLGLKTHLQKAEFIEWGIGYRL